MRYINISKERICLLEGWKLRKSSSFGKTLAMCFKAMSKGIGAMTTARNILPKEHVCSKMGMELWVIIA